MEAIQAAEGAEADVIAIGPAGERLVRFACLAHYWKNREGVAGRGGIGAVLGAKHVKAVVVRGSRKTEVADPARLKQLLEETREPLKKGTANLTTYGTPFLAGPINALGALGAYNLKQETFAEGRRSTGARSRSTTTTGTRRASSARSRAASSTRSATAIYGGVRAKMPEYETIFAFGSMLGNANAPSIVHANDLCDLLGLDTISMGVTLAFVAEALERGLLRPDEVGGPSAGRMAGHAAPGRADGAPRGIRRPSGRGRVAAGRRSVPRPSACPTR